MRTREPKIISKNNEPNEILTEFYKIIEKQGVKPRNKKQEELERVLGIKNRKYTSVQAVVEDMKNRSGYTKYISKQGSTENLPNILKQYPQIKNTIDNYVKSTNGNIVLQAIIEKIRSIYKNEVKIDFNWDDEEFKKYIENLIKENKKITPVNNDGNLGIITRDEQDIKDEDFLSTLMPNKF